MNIQVTGIIALLVGILFLVRGPEFAIKIFVPSTLLASCAAIIVPSLGTATIQPAHLLLGFLTICTLKSQTSWKSITECLNFPREGFWLIALVAYGLATAYLSPRIFSGATYVNAIGASEFGFSLIQVPLGPTSGNITQSIYFVGDLVCFLICYSIARTPEGFKSIFTAMMAYCFMNILFAVLDVITFWTGTGYLIGFLRNSTYTLHNETVVNGLKRIVGSFTEASAFAYATIGVFGFSLRLWLGGIAPKITFFLAATNAILLIFSTSTTAYAALPILGAYAYFTNLWKAGSGPVPRQVILFLVLAPLVVLLVATLVLLNPTTAEFIKSFLNILLFDKSSSESALDRGRWNEAAINAFTATYGIGAGIGSVRASSFLLAVLANLGVVGMLGFGAFVLLVLFKRSNSHIGHFTTEVQAASRMGCVGILIAASISGALIDLGLPFFVLAALATGANHIVLPSLLRRTRKAPVTYTFHRA